MTEPIDRLLQDSQEYLRGFIEHAMRDKEKLCESPIEIIFFQAMTIYSLIVSGVNPCVEAKKWRKIGWLIEPQKQVLNYRVDFLLSGPGIKVQFVVECDGHDYHERTKEQAAKDRSRDRALTAAGYRVIRFTGGELYNDPWQCALDIEAQYLNVCDLERARIA